MEETTTYLITYDLVNEKDYKDLIEELKRYGCEKRLLSAWVLWGRPSGQAAALRRHFREFIDNDDLLIVGELSDYDGPLVELKTKT